MRPRFRLIAVVGAALALAACGGEDEAPESSARGCEQVSAPQGKQVSLPAPKQIVERGKKLNAVMRTSCGSFEIALDTKRAPKTVNSFVYLAREGFYDGLSFHRIARDFVIQGGDPLGDGTGDAGYKVDEKPPPNLAYTKGVVAMAKSGAEPPGRSGSQFFVITVPAANLSPDYALVGRVSSGIDVVDRIAALGTPTERPRQPVLIERVTIKGG